MALRVDQITKTALLELMRRGCDVWRQNNTRSVRGRKFTGRIGVPDIIGFQKTTGVFVACEVKTEKDTMSQQQFLFLLTLKRAGGISLVAMEEKRTGNVLLYDLEEAIKEKPGLLRAG